MTDRPTGPATAAGRALFALLWDARIMWPDEYTQIAPSVVSEQIIKIEAEQKARILAALPEAIDAVGTMLTDDEEEHEYGIVLDSKDAAAALAAAIERVLGEET